MLIYLKLYQILKMQGRKSVSNDSDSYDYRLFKLILTASEMNTFFFDLRCRTVICYDRQRPQTTTKHQQTTTNYHKPPQTIKKRPRTTTDDHKSPANDHNKNKTKENFSKF